MNETERSTAPAVQVPIPMLLTCPACSKRHVDQGEFATKPHTVHACQHCGATWRPCVEATVGVEFLPGFRDAEELDRPNTQELGAMAQELRGREIGGHSWSSSLSSRIEHLIAYVEMLERQVATMASLPSTTPTRKPKVLSLSEVGEIVARRMGPQNTEGEGV